MNKNNSSLDRYFAETEIKVQEAKGDFKSPSDIMRELDMISIANRERSKKML